jgi:ketosteroid isomerase-like protein
MGMVTPSFGQDLREQQLEVFFNDLAEAAEAGDKTAYTRLFMPNAAMFLPHRPPLLGQEQIGHWFDDFRQTVILVLDSYEQEQVDIVGDVAIIRSRGVGHYLVKATQEQVPFDQKYLDVLRYDGSSWHMTYHVANSSTFDPAPVWVTANIKPLQ